MVWWEWIPAFTGMTEREWECHLRLDQGSTTQFVIPDTDRESIVWWEWIPAFAGMTERGRGITTFGAGVFGPEFSGAINVAPTHGFSHPLCQWAGDLRDSPLPFIALPASHIRHPRESGDPWHPNNSLDSHFRGNDGKGVGMAEREGRNDKKVGQE